jgi:hypothetical protein
MFRLEARNGRFRICAVGSGKDGSLNEVADDPLLRSD